MCLTLLTLINFIGLFHSLFWIKLKRPVGVNLLKGFRGHFLYEPQFVNWRHQQYKNYMRVYMVNTESVLQYQQEH